MLQFRSFAVSSLIDSSSLVLKSIHIFMHTRSYSYLAFYSLVIRILAPDVDFYMMTSMCLEYVLDVSKAVDFKQVERIRFWVKFVSSTNLEDFRLWVKIADMRPFLFLGFVCSSASRQELKELKMRYHFNSHNLDSHFLPFLQWYISSMHRC